jgi:hypothetical protein
LENSYAAEEVHRISRHGGGASAITFSMETTLAMKPLLKQIQHTPLLWMLLFVPVVLVAEAAVPHSHTLLFALSVLAIVPLARSRCSSHPRWCCSAMSSDRRL